MKLFIALSFGCILFIYAIFLKSFFPARKSIAGFAEHADYVDFSDDKVFNRSHSRINNQNVPIYNKLIIMLVDALRADFVFDAKSSMSHVKDLRREGKALSYIAKVHPPTVTLPRLKVFI